ncbi:hypothetical protein M409DRAFT_17435 [Zasmidium cellare ATCC 36951]|uniref:HIG1 domain-containing protein n=1 Tax=Zasmidium cellare ATCC 36951 TaxID=1080233 RepID=A0A6A6CYS3_ZASCE|nr:uncharacterized protein M409DRAFT_17435 [Zasmidium cellare ATCC 36951]KAF2172195.1 hypothetical protein M409DRAFT_17435 [Zasmidium cellare ATCC 36951]
MSVPGNINTAPPPSSFDEETEFYEESRWQKLKRRLVEEPLIPLGCALTCWALYEATKSIRSGDKHRTNRMFRRRIYAQGFTTLAMIGGSVYWEGDRAKRRQYDALVDEKQKKEKHEAWIKELEVREQEEQELRQLRDRLIKGKVAEKQKFGEEDRRALEDQAKKNAGQEKGGFGEVRSALEEGERRGRIFEAARELWQSRR